MEEKPSTEIDLGAAAAKVKPKEGKLSHINFTTA